MWKAVPFVDDSNSIEQSYSARFCTQQWMTNATESHLKIVRMYQLFSVNKKKQMAAYLSMLLMPQKRDTSL